MEARHALETFERLGASRDSDAAAALLRELGATARTFPKGYGALTKRETEVLSLLAEGCSNAEIAGRLYISHMGAGHLVVFNLDSSRVVGDVQEVDRATGVWAVPSHHAIYVSAAGRHEVAVIDDRTLAVVARVGGIKFPDGIAFAPRGCGA